MTDTVPADFPRQLPLGVVSGTSLKLLLRRVGGSYTNESSDEEIRERYDFCVQLAEALIEAAQKDQARHPEFAREQALRRVRNAIVDKEWVSEPETEWTINRLRTHLHW